MLLVAAGGGGDAITATVLGHLFQPQVAPVVMTYSWDRLILDPLPGPRTAADFDGLHQLAPHLYEVLPTTTPRPPAGSALPRLADELPARFLLLDPTRGAVGLAKQISATATHFGETEIGLVDVGGDVLTKGNEPGLRSPLADLLTLAACLRVDLVSTLLVVGPGIDGELDEHTVLDRLTTLGATETARLDAASVAAIRNVFTWHPSEASGLVAAAATGHRGNVETRDAGRQVQLNDRTPTVHTLDAQSAAETAATPRLRSTTSLAEAVDVVHDATGVDEISFETEKAARLQHATHHPTTAVDLADVDTCSAEAADRGADYLTVRRLAELIGVTTLHGLNGLHTMLAHERPGPYDPPLYRTERKRVGAV